MTGMDALGLLFKFLLGSAWFGLCGGQITFTSQPIDTVVPPNAPLQISCTASSSLSGVLHILWRRNGTWIVDFTNKHYRLLQNGSLQFEQFLPADQGLYQCSALVIDSSHNHLGQIYSRIATIKIAYIEDLFVVNPETRSVLIGSNMQLQCISPRSEPIAQVHWEKDNVKLSGYENGSLILLSEKTVSSSISIKNVTSHDTGTYKCAALNRLLPGKTVRSMGATISITALQRQPYFEKRPTSIVANRHQLFIWECHIRGVPEPVVQWYHNGQAITNDQNRMKLASGSLHFVSVLKQYNGSYVCEGSNNLGRISSQPVAFIVAFIDYDFVADPTPSIITSGSTLLLHCIPPPSYPAAVTITWYKDYTRLFLGGTISVTAENSLRISSITRSSEGVYFCQAYNPVTRESRTSRTANVAVREIPRIQTVLTNRTVAVGDRVVMNCTATGHPTPSFRWIKGSTAISNSESMILSAVKLNDSGFYSCVATNSAGNDSKRFYLHVSSKPVATVLPSNQTKVVGQQVEFNCNFAGTPKPITVWYFMARGSPVRLPLAFNSRIGRTSTGIRVSSLAKSDEGRYICSGSSSGGSSEVYAFLTVQVPPTFLVRPSNQTAVVSSSFTMRCEASGDPLPTISWLFGARVLSNGAKYRISSNSLTVNSVVVGDMGWYTCSIINAAGNQTALAYVDIYVSPVITEFFVPQRVRAGDRFTITCKGSGNPKPLVTWRRNSTTPLQIDGSRISGNETHVVIAQARSSDSGNYECILANLVNRVTRSSFLTVQVLPYPPNALTARSVLSTAIEIQWLEGFNGFSIIIRYDLEMLRQGTTQWRVVDANIPRNTLKYTVTGLTPYTMYSFRMRTHTGVGQSVYSVVASVTTLEDAPSIPLGIQILSINATSAVVRWSPPTMPNGNVTIYQLVYGVVGSSESKDSTIREERKVAHEMQIKPLKPFTEYFVRIRAATVSSNISKWGNYSSSINFRTAESVPSDTPAIKNVTSQTSTSILVSFSPIQTSLINGILSGYLVTVRVGIDKRTIKTNETSITMMSLRKATPYEVYVQACSRVGCGPNSSPVAVTTLEDVPGIVSNATAVAISSTSMLIKWFEPSEKNGIITGYVVIIRNASGLYVENITLPRDKLELRKDGLPSNRTYFVSIAAKTKVGVGTASPEITVMLRDVEVPATPTLPKDTTTFSSTSLTTTKKPVITAISSDTSQSVDWLHKDNYPILIGVSVAIFLLLIFVIVLIAWTFSRRIKSETVKRQRWLSTRTESGGDNPAFIPNGDVELEGRAGKGREQRPKPDITVADTDSKHEDFVFESDSEPSQIMGSINPSNQYASDDTALYKEKDDSPLFKLRSTEVDLSDNASEYDKPYSSIEEVMEPIPDLFSFIDEEDRKSEKTTPDTQSINDVSDSGSRRYDGHTEHGDPQELQSTGYMPNRRSPNQTDLTWDNYDTSNAAAHSSDEHGYAVPSLDDSESARNSPTVGKKKQKVTDKAVLLDHEETII